MFGKVMVVNRGEIALRVLRTLREMSIQSVAALSSVDIVHSLPLADQVICIGNGDPQQSYMNSHRILSAALACQVDALHPGYGFLAEDASFSRLCAEMGITFIGPSGEVMEKLANKAASCRLAAKLKVPNLFLDVMHEEGDARRLSGSVDFPVVIKPVVGGGGRGIRLVERPERFLPQFKQALAEIPVQHRDAGFYAEIYLAGARHLEVQVLRDKHDRVAVFPPRDCSLQYRNQKWVEETPPALSSPRLVKELEEKAKLIIENSDLVGLATVEYLVRGDEYFFIEVNPRLQVEHTITELVAGVDLVREQIRLAAGEGLEEFPPVRGHAIEARLYALPSGENVDFSPPGGPGIRVDSFLGQSGNALLFYDPLLAKICAWALDRGMAISRMLRALEETMVHGAVTNLPLIQRVVGSDAYVRGEYNINTLSEMLGGESWISWRE